MKNKPHYTGVTICLILMAVPFLFMPFWDAENSSEYRNAAAFPQLILPEGEGINSQFPMQFEAWYQDHFAFRQPLIALNSFINLRVFHTSQIDDVIIGRSDRLFYRPTTPDFEDKAALSTEELTIIVKNLQLMQAELEQKGAELYVAIAPNKNTIYPEDMPVAFRFRDGGGNQDRLYEALSATGIHAIDLRTPLLRAKETENLYHLTDTHWNCNGAVVATEELLRYLKDEPYDDVPRPNRTSTYTQGDLARMLGLQGVIAERAPDFSDARIYDKGINYLNRDFLLRGDGEGTLCIFRDSFTSTVGPLLHKYFSETRFRWEIPFDITDIGDVDAVLILLVERNIRDLLETPLCESADLSPNFPDDGKDYEEYEEDADDFDDLQRLREELAGQ